MTCCNFKFAILLSLLLASASALAIDDDEIRAQVMKVDEAARTVTVQPFEVGKDIDIPTDEPTTFKVDKTTQIRDQVQPNRTNELGDIRENDIVRMDFDIRDGGGMIARNITRDGGQAAIQQERDRQQLPAELPDTASAWPLLAVGGFGVWALALLLRLERRKS